VRRLLTLMALALSLPAVRPRTGFSPATPMPLPEGTELATFPAPRRFSLSGRVQPEVDPEASGPPGRCPQRPTSTPGASPGRLITSVNAATRNRMPCPWPRPIACARNLA
jgi:hypothetical protein